jgi:hypothetical protein
VNHDLVVELLREVRYRPGWTVTAHRHPFGSYILIDAEVLDSEKWDDALSVEENYRRGNTTRVGVRACVPPQHETYNELYDWLEWRLGKVEIHEMREFFMVGGKPWNSPHKRVQPKHDYHVRKDEQIGLWVAYQHHDYGLDDKFGPVVATAHTMREAYMGAIQRIVEDDLQKGIVGPNG